MLSDKILPTKHTPEFINNNVSRQFEKIQVEYLKLLDSYNDFKDDKEPKEVFIEKCIDLISSLRTLSAMFISDRDFNAAVLQVNKKNLDKGYLTYYKSFSDDDLENFFKLKCTLKNIGIDTSDVDLISRQLIDMSLAASYWNRYYGYLNTEKKYKDLE